MTTARAMGERVAERYVIYDPIAAGGMAVVHYGRLLGGAGFARTVAIKRLQPQFARDREFRAMFLDEARLAARIQHPNVVQTLDVIEAGAELMLVMDYVAGESLSRLMAAARARGERIAPSVVATLAIDILRGLHAAHEARDERGRPLNIVHRDVSPQNVLVGRDGIARVLDFGIAKAAHRSQVTQEGQFKGKVGYAAPEHLCRETLDRRADIYALGVVCWEALCGRRLFEGDDHAIMAKVAKGDIPAPQSLVADLPPGFVEIVLRALSGAPSARFASADVMAREIEEGVQLAKPSQVRAWAERLADDALNERAKLVADIESISITAPLGNAAFEERRVLAADLPTTVPPVRRRPRRWRRRALVAFTTALLATIPLLLHATSHRGATSTAYAEVTPVPSAPLALIPTPPFAEVIRAPPAPAEAAPAGDGELATAPRPPAAARGRRTPSGPSAKVTKVASTHATPVSVSSSSRDPARPDCEVPYQLDSAGRRRFKLECL